VRYRYEPGRLLFGYQWDSVTESNSTGVFPSEDEIVTSIEAVLKEKDAELKEKRYAAQGPLLALARERCPFGDRGILVAKFNQLIEKLLGPKTDADKKPAAKPAAVRSFRFIRAQPNPWNRYHSYSPKLLRLLRLRLKLPLQLPPKNQFVSLPPRRMFSSPKNCWKITLRLHRVRLSLDSLPNPTYVYQAGVLSIL